MDPHQKAAQTRFANDVKQAKGQTPAVNVATPQYKRQKQLAAKSSMGRQQPPQLPIQSGPQPQLEKVPVAPRVPPAQLDSPVEGPMDALIRQVHLEEFLQSPALQEAITRAKLIEFFRRDTDGGATDPKAEFAMNVLGNMSRY